MSALSFPSQAVAALLNEAQAAEVLGCKPQSLRVWRCVGRHDLPYVKVGRLVRYRLSDLEKWLAARTVTSTGAADAAGL